MYLVHELQVRLHKVTVPQFMKTIAFWRLCLPLSFCKWGHWNPAKVNACRRPTWISNRADLEHSSRFPSQYLYPKLKGQSNGQCFLRQSRPDLLIKPFHPGCVNCPFQHPVLYGPFSNALSLGSAWTSTPGNERIYTVFTSILTQDWGEKRASLPRCRFQVSQDWDNR